MESYNEYFIELLIKCENCDEEAILEYNKDYWHDKEKKLTIDGKFVASLNELSNKNSYVMNALGMIYLFSQQMNIDKSKAIDFFRKGVDLGNHNSMNNLAYIIQSKIDKSNKDYMQDPYFIEAEQLFKNAIKKGNKFSIQNLGIMYYDQWKTNREPTGKNCIEAIKIFKDGEYWSGFIMVLKDIFAYCDQIDVEILESIISDVDEKVYGTDNIKTLICIVKGCIEHQKTIARHEIGKTILRTKKIPVEIINNEINSKI